MQAIGYIRLSFKDQSKYSLDAQESAIRSYCTKYQLDLIALFKDNGQSSSTFDRLDFKALESFVKKHKGSVRYMVVMEHDRFSRDLSEALSKIDNLEAKYRLKVLSVDEPLDLDPSDPSVFINRAFKYATANMELLNIRARTKRGIKSAQLSGRFINKAPFGYKNEKDFSDRSTLTVVAEEAIIIRQIFYYYLSDVSISQIAKEVIKVGFSNKGNSAIRRVLSNYLYGGLIRVVDNDNSETYVKAIHEAIISEADYWLVQEMIAKKNHRKLKLINTFP